MDDVGRFIQKFQNKESSEAFAGDCSYWFAVILHRKFIRHRAEIMIEESGGQFGTRINGRVYDITGDVTGKCKWVPWLKVSDNKIRQETNK